ncbi:MAG: Spy/CpxP family protein refolding chaperone [Bacteroidetes bacterium]|nr:Spy/CpxP family protein refolding chaperone [Bacteroidota bacterium]
MEIFKQRKILIRLIALLLAVNLMTIGCFLWKDIFHKVQGENPPAGKRDLSGILKKELNLSEKQVQQIKQLRIEYIEKEKLIETQIRGERDSINVAMFNKAIDEELVVSLAKKVAENEYKMEMLRFEQAKKFKSFCRPEQLEKFEQLVLEVRDCFKPDSRPEKK